MTKKGRPVKSEIRQNIIEILYFLGEGYGYEIYKIYKEVFPKCTNKVIYYHLKKGVETGEFKIERIENENGEYSWGNSAERIYYTLGDFANPKIKKRVKEAIKKLKR
ncbi:MAG: hypothetical protein ACQESF_05605 [Nanobdellota archaeon]